MSLAVITCHFNPAGYSNPRRNLLRFMRQMEAEGVPVFVAELAYDEAPWLLPEAPNILRLRASSSDVMWHKENLLNLVEKIVPEEFDALAWIDADLWFQRLDWFQATEEALQKHAVVQLFDKVVLTSMDGSFSSVSHGAGYAGKLTPGSTNPGFAWAARRSLWREAGGLFDRAAIGGGDMLHASVWLPTEPSPYDWLHYKGVPGSLEMLRTWCTENGGCGGVQGTIWHEWHGDTQDRRYAERHGMMREFDIEMQLVRRKDGLLEFADTVSASLRTQIRAYFTSRTEDGNVNSRSLVGKQKLHFGCGPVRLDGWENLDLPEVDLCQPLPFANDSAQCIFLEHVIEHIGIHDAYRFFIECFRVLCAEGVVRLAFPSIPKIWTSGSKGYLDYQKAMGWGNGTRASGVKAMIFEHGHKTVWTPQLMIAILESLGFSAREYPIGFSDTPSLRDLEQHSRKNPQAWESTVAQTVSVEARKPRNFPAS